MECPGETEAYYILSGRIRLLPQGETEITLGPGDVFYFTENETLLPFHVLDPLQMILFSNESRFEQDAETNRALLDVMEALQEIDGDTR
ncbi:MAG: cupin domain-containing protein, partial [Pygmaiobacter massiliensis]